MTKFISKKVLKCYLRKEGFKYKNVPIQLHALTIPISRIQNKVPLLKLIQIKGFSSDAVIVRKFYKAISKLL